MQVISFSDADDKMSWKGVADAIHAGHLLSRAEIGDMLLQQNSNALLSRGAWIPELGMALKSMSIFPQNASAQPPVPTIQGGVLLFDGKDGGLSAVIDGVLVTKWKTAGDSVLGARLLANPEPKTHLTVGAGTVAASIIEAYAELFPSIETFHVWNRTHTRAEELARSLPYNIVPVTNLPAACEVSSIITTATMSKTPVLQGDWIAPGTHVDLIGAFTPEMREADDILLQRSELFVDSFDTTVGHIGEIEMPLRSGAIARSDLLGDFYDLCNGKVTRSSEEAITVFKNGGGAHLDLMTSQYVYKVTQTGTS